VATTDPTAAAEIKSGFWTQQRITIIAPQSPAQHQDLDLNLNLNLDLDIDLERPHDSVETKPVLRYEVVW
jgi:hypothetical protein